MMYDVYDPEGQLIAHIPLSERNLELLDAGSSVTINYHTPIMMRGTLGDWVGRFMLFKQDDQIRAKTEDRQQVEAYAYLQENIVAQRAP